MKGPKRLLLICNSTLHGSGYLDHPEPGIVALSRSQETGRSSPTRCMIAQPVRTGPARPEATGHAVHSVHEPGLPAGSMLVVDGAAVTLRGRAAARVFREEDRPVEIAPGGRLDHLFA